MAGPTPERRSAFRRTTEAAEEAAVVPAAVVPAPAASSPPPPAAAAPPGRPAATLLQEARGRAEVERGVVGGELRERYKAAAAAAGEAELLFWIEADMLLFWCWFC